VLCAILLGRAAVSRLRARQVAILEQLTAAQA